DPGQGQLLVLNRIPENQAVFEDLQSAIVARPKQRGIANDRLERKVFAEHQVIENFRDDLGILAHRRIGRNPYFNRGTKSRVYETVAGNVLIDGITRTQIYIADSSGNVP